MVVLVSCAGTSCCLSSERPCRCQLAHPPSVRSMHITFQKCGHDCCCTCGGSHIALSHLFLQQMLRTAYGMRSTTHHSTQSTVQRTQRTAHSIQSTGQHIAQSTACTTAKLFVHIGLPDRWQILMADTIGSKHSAHRSVFTAASSLQCLRCSYYTTACSLQRLHSNIFNCSMFTAASTLQRLHYSIFDCIVYSAVSTLQRLHCSIYTAASSTAAVHCSVYTAASTPQRLQIRQVFLRCGSISQHVLERGVKHPEKHCRTEARHSTRSMSSTTWQHSVEQHMAELRVSGSKRANKPSSGHKDFKACLRYFGESCHSVLGFSETRFRLMWPCWRSLDSPSDNMHLFGSYKYRHIGR